MSIFEILNPTSEETTSTPATTTETNTDVLAAVEKLSEQVKALALQATDPEAYREAIKEAEEKKKKERASTYFSALSEEKQTKIFEAFEKDEKSAIVTQTSIKAEITSTINDLKTKGVTDPNALNSIASAIMGFDVTNKEAIKAEAIRRTEANMEVVEKNQLDELANAYNRYERFVKLFK